MRAGGPIAAKVARGGLDPELLRLLWPSVLPNVHRGSWAKAVAIRQILARVEARSAELPRLLPLLAAALRPSRSPERRAGLSAIVQLAERDGAAALLGREAFLELEWAGLSAAP